MRDSDLEDPETGTKAWKSRLDEKLKEERGCLDAWVLYSPGSHPFWSFYLMSVIHLREVKNMPPPVLKTPESTHEFMIHALSPEYDKDLDPDNPGTYYPLHPINLSKQIESSFDEEAIRILGFMAGESLRMSVDTDYRKWWDNYIDQLTVKGIN